MTAISKDTTLVTFINMFTVDPANTSITLTTLVRVAAALGCKVKLEIVVPR